MKKILALILVIAMMLSMTACDVDSSVKFNDAKETTESLSSNDATIAENEQIVDIQRGEEDREWVVGDCNVYIHDDADLLSDDEEQDLLNLVAQYANDMYFNVLFLTYDDADGKTTKEYSDDYMDNIFPVGVEDNIAFVIDMDNQEAYINTMGKAIQWIGDDDIDKALNAGWDHIGNKEYSYFFIDVADHCLEILANGGRR